VQPPARSSESAITDKEWDESEAEESEIPAGATISSDVRPRSISLVTSGFSDAADLPTDHAA
jgi:hypothetical protein